MIYTPPVKDNYSTIHLRILKSKVSTTNKNYNNFYWLELIWTFELNLCIRFI